MEIHQNPSRYREQSVSASIGAQNTFTPPVFILGDFNFSLSGTWAGTVFIQRSFDGGSDLARCAKLHREHPGHRVRA